MKKVAVLMVLSLVLVSCGGRQQRVAVTRDLKPRPITLPDPIPAEPAFRLTFEKTPRPQIVNRLLKIAGVAVAVPVDRRALMVKAGDHKVRLRVGSASALLFRSIAPNVTSQADFVWSSLLQGEAVVTPTAASRLGITGATAIEIGRRSFTVGAFADNAVPNLADVLLSDHVAKKLDLKPTAIVVGAKPKASLEKLRVSIQDEVPSGRLHRLQPRPDAPAPEPVGTAEGGLIGAMTFRIRKNGFIEPDPAWVSANIVQADLPVLGSVMCHRLMVPQLGAALAEIERKRLSGLIDTRGYGGCYVPRFIGRDPRRGLSMHAFGLAVDLNVPTNHYGTRGDMDPRVVAIFAKWGFGWGGHWSTPDPMHFELTRLLPS